MENEISFHNLAINDIITFDTVRLLVLGHTVQKAEKPEDKDIPVVRTVTLDGKAQHLLSCERLVTGKATVNRFGSENVVVKYTKAEISAG